MMNNIKLLSTILISVVAGLLIGYFIFNKNQTQSTDANAVSRKDHANHSIDEETIWTCSMHPQVRQNEPGLCPICEMDLIPLEAKSSDDPLLLEMTPEAVKLAQVQTTIIGNRSGDTQKTIQLTGKVQADERQASSQVAHVPGRIEKLYVSFTGEQVNAGQKMASIYSPELIAAQKELLEAIKLQDISPGLPEAARNKLRYWKIDDATITAIETAGKVQENFDIYAAASGVVTNRRVSVGDYIKQGFPLFDLMNLDKVWVLFDVYEENLKNISTGDLIEFTTPALPGKKFKTRITFIDPVINPKTRTASVRAELSNKSGQLKPEMFVNGFIQKSSNNKAQLTVPKTAVLWTGKRSVVYVKIQDTEIPTFQYREVELGESTGFAYLITAGLTEGEEVVTHGNFSIDAAAQLNNQASMMNQHITIKKEKSSTLPNYQNTTPEAFKIQLQKLSDQYIRLKDAFVATNLEAVKEAANHFIVQSDKVDINLVEGDAHVLSTQYLNGLKSHAQKIRDLNDIEDQRKQFHFISKTLIETIKVFGIQDGDLFIQYCPMVFENQGADWIAKEEQIKNPYFGEKMMNCGSVKEIVSGK